MVSSSSSEEAFPTEDVVLALLEYFVQPMLPLKSSAREDPSLAKQQAVAKQVYAVVLLYNYYQRKRHPEAEFLGFESFCKLAVVLKPVLMAHMKLMHRSDLNNLDDLEKQLSLTEKAIMDACDVSSALDASKDVPEIEGWPISKVAVLLIDSRRENCLLVFSSVTHGVWSIIEKDLDASRVSSESTVDRKQINKRKRNTKNSLKHELNADEAGLQQLAFTAIKDTAGISQTDLAVLESHVVYSLSKEKTVARFYIVQCIQSINEDLQVPIKDAVRSLQGPLVEKRSHGWMVTPVVEYLHVLPYAGILSDWFSREVSLNNLQDLRVELENANVNSSHGTENPCGKAVAEDTDKSYKNCGIIDSISKEASNGNSESPKPKDNDGGQVNFWSNSVDVPHCMDVDTSVVCPQNEDTSRSSDNMVKVYNHQKIITSMGSDIHASTSGVKFEGEMVGSMTKSCVTECRDEKVDTENKICAIISSDQDGVPVGDRALFPSQSNSNNPENLQVTLALKENELSETSLRVLLRKREKLSHKLRNLEDEIALCDKNIQTILDGGEDDLALKIEAIIDGCNDVCLHSEVKTQGRNYQQVEEESSPKSMKRKRLSEAILTLQNSCQELDGICYRNNWMLPTYRVSPSDGGFLANVTMKGLDFEFSVGSDLLSHPREARESAAGKMITKLKSMAGQNQ